MITQNFISRALLFFAIGAALFLSLYKLSESPPIWMDEGIITQVAENMATHGVHGIQVAPGEFVSAGFVTTSYAVTYPISLFFKVFGVGILPARAVMVIFLFAFFTLAYFLIKQETPKTLAVLAFLLLVSFAPIYGNGKNVLGEIPGLTFLFAGFLCAGAIERGLRTVTPFLLAGLFFGLCVVTKPVFLVLLPALVLPLYFYRTTMLRNPKFFGYALLTFCAPVLVWLFVQFSGDSLGNMLSIYANPHNTSPIGSVAVNIKRFVTEAQPMYFLFLFAGWALTFFIRLRNKISISYVESVAFLFSLFIFLAYLRTIGYYRYFFLAQVLALVYFPLAITTIGGNKISKFVKPAVLGVLVLFQLYQTGFHSWVASYYYGTRTREVSAYFKAQPPEQSFFLYQAPEIALFLPSSEYFQYMEVTSTIFPGKEQLKKIEAGVPDQIVLNSEQYDPKNALFAKYQEKKVVDRYTILEKKPGKK